jgi:hypothetical protein
MIAPVFTFGQRWRQFQALTKPRVIQLIVFCVARSDDVQGDLGSVVLVSNRPPDSRRASARSRASTSARSKGLPK